LTRFVKQYRLGKIYYAPIDVFLPVEATNVQPDILFLAQDRRRCSLCRIMDRSILTATSLPDLVCDTTEAYIARAVHLATHPDELIRIRRRPADNQTTAPLFQPSRFICHLEQAYHQMWAQYIDGKKEHIRVKSED
jgi:hypothetical protein